MYSVCACVCVVVCVWLCVCESVIHYHQSKIKTILTNNENVSKTFENRLGQIILEIVITSIMDPTIPGKNIHMVRGNIEIRKKSKIIFNKEFGKFISCV